LEGKPELARKEFEQQIAAAPDYAPTYYKLGAMDLSKRDLKDAEAMFKKSIELDSAPAKGRIIPTKLAEPRIALGKIYEATTRPSDAEQMYRDALTIRPDSREARYRLAIVLEHEGKNEEAIVELKKILLANPADPQGLVELGYLLGKVGRLGDAQVCFDEALKLDPNNKDAKMGLGLIKSAVEAQTRASTQPSTRASTRPTTQARFQATSRPATTTVAQ
jgi:tetratricopeptide (TPR) repeat protein